MSFKRYIICFLLLVIGYSGFAQIKSGKVTYERKTNLYKKYKDDDVREWIREEDKNKIDFFELFFNDTMSVFKPVESELKENYSWATSKNSVYQNFNTNTIYMLKTIWGESIPLRDSLAWRKWKITDNTRNIAGYKCRKAIWCVNDSTRLYAWFSQELETGTGPETFNGLPGVILGLAPEDGGVVYFAKKVEVIKPEPSVFVAPKTKSKVYSTKELKAKLEKDYGKEKWGKAMIKDQFGVW